MQVLGTQIREQLGRLGIAPETLDARLKELSTGGLERLKSLETLDAQATLSRNRFSGELKDARSDMPEAFSNPPPRHSRASIEPFIHQTYAQDASPTHASADDPWPHLLSPNRHEAATMGLALQRRPELRESVGTSLGAMIADDGRADGIITVQRGPQPGSPGAPRAPVSPPTAPTRDYRNASIWEIMLAMDQAILEQAAALGVGSGSTSGDAGTVDMMQAMGLWSLTPDEGDPSEWMAFGQAGSAGTSAAGQAGFPEPAPDPGLGAPTGTVGPENQNSGTDVEIMNLKRQIDKKTQMMELYSQTIDKFDQSANNIITNMKG